MSIFTDGSLEDLLHQPTEKRNEKSEGTLFRGTKFRRTKFRGTEFGAKLLGTGFLVTEFLGTEFLDTNVFILAFYLRDR